jgi:hypothetical protein
VRLRFRASGLPKVDMMGLIDPLLRISRVQPNGSFRKVYETEWVAKNKDPMWDEFTVTVQDLCGGDYNEALLFEVWDHDKVGSDNYVGQFTTSLSELLSGRADFKVLDKKNSGRDLGAVHVVVCRFETGARAELSAGGEAAKLARRDEIAVQDPDPNVELVLRLPGAKCTALPNMDTFGKTDCFLVFSRLTDGGRFEEVERTKTIDSDLNPVWDVIDVPLSRLLYRLDPNTTVKVDAWDQDPTSNDHIGQFTFVFSDLVRAKQGTFNFKGKKEGKSYGACTFPRVEIARVPKDQVAKAHKKISKGVEEGVPAEEADAERALQQEIAASLADMKLKHQQQQNHDVTFRLGARGLPKMDTFGSADPFFTLQGLNADGTLSDLYKCKHISDTLEPNWPEFTLPLRELCPDGNYTRQLVITVFDHDITGADLIGRCSASLPELRVRRKIDILDPSKAGSKKYKNSGALEIMGLDVHPPRGESKEERDARALRESLAKGPQTGKDAYSGHNAAQRKLQEQQFKGKVLNIKFGAQRLPTMDTLGSIDPYLKVKRMEDNGQYTDVFKTEVVKNNKNPTFAAVAVPVEKLVGDNYNRTLLVEVWDQDMTSDELAGRVTLTLPELMDVGKDFAVAHPKGKQGKDCGVLVIVSAELATEDEFRAQKESFEQKKLQAKSAPKLSRVDIENEANRSVTLVLAVSEVAKTDRFGNPDPYIVIKRVEDDSSAKKVLQTEALKSTKQGTFKEFTLPMAELVRGRFNRAIILEVWDEDVGYDDFVGRVSTTLEELMACPTLELLDGKTADAAKKSKRGNLIVQKCEVTETVRDEKLIREAAEYARAKIPAAALDNIVELTLRCANVEKMDLTGASDPYLVLNRPHPVDGRLTKVARTETVNNNANPQFKPLRVTLRELCGDDYRSPVVIECRDDDFGSDDFIGQVMTNLVDLFEPRGFAQPLADPKRAREKGYTERGAGGRLEVARARLLRPDGTTELDPDRELAEARRAARLGAGAGGPGKGRTVVLEFCATGLRKVDTFGENDCFFSLKKLARDGTYALLHKSEVVDNSNDPKWKPFEMTVDAITGGDLGTNLLFEVWDKDTIGGPNLVGKFTTTLPTVMAHLTAHKPFELVDPKKVKSKGYTSSGLFHVTRCDLREEQLNGRPPGGLIGDLSRAQDNFKSPPRGGSGARPDSRTILLRFSGKKLEGASQAYPPRAFLTVSHLTNDNNYQLVYQSEVNQVPGPDAAWKGFSLPLDGLVDGNLKRGLLFEVYDYDVASRRSDLIGHFTTSLPEMLSRLWFPLVHPEKRRRPGYTSSGLLAVEQCEIHEANRVVQGGGLGNFLDDAGAYADEIDDLHSQIYPAPGSGSGRKRPQSAGSKRPQSAGHSGRRSEAALSGPYSSRKQPPPTANFLDFESPEEMREQISRLKRQVGALQQENVKLTTKLLHSEEETRKRERQLEELLDAKSSSTHFKTLRSETALTCNLKNEVKYLKTTLLERDRQVTALKKLLKQQGFK